MSIEKEVESMDEKKLRELIIKAFDGIKRANKSLDESHEAVQKALNLVTMVDRNLNIVHVNKAESGGYLTEDGRVVWKDNHGFFVVVKSNEVLRPIQTLNERELIELFNCTLDSTIKHTEETHKYLRKTLEELSNKK